MPARELRVDREGGYGLRVRELGPLATRVRGRPVGDRVFLCLHGLVDSLEIWDGLAPALARRGRVLLMDQRAHGESGAPEGPCSREDLADDAVAVLDRLGVRRAVFVGHSMGGIVSLAAALRHPERVVGLVLLGTASQCSERVASWYEEIARAGETRGLAGLAEEIHGEGTRRAVRGDAGGIAQVTRMLRSLFDDPLTPKLARVRCPALLVVGEKDPMGPRASAILHDHLPDATLEVLPGLGHWTQVQAPERVLSALDGWLEAGAV